MSLINFTKSNYIVYQEFRKTTEKFAKTHPEVDVLDLSTVLTKEAFYDGAHVYDDVNDTIAQMLVKAVAVTIEHEVGEISR